MTIYQNKIQNSKSTTKEHTINPKQTPQLSNAVTTATIIVLFERTSHLSIFFVHGFLKIKAKQLHFVCPFSFFFM